MCNHFHAKFTCRECFHMLQACLPHFISHKPTQLQESSFPIFSVFCTYLSTNDLCALISSFEIFSSQDKLRKHNFKMNDELFRLPTFFSPFFVGIFVHKDWCGVFG